VQPQTTQPIARVPPPTTRRPARGTSIVVAMVIVVVVAALGFIAFWHSAFLEVTVGSTHIAFTVAYQLRVDDAIWAQGTLGPLESQITNRSVSWLGGSCKSVIVFAISEGGGLGSQSDEEMVTLCGGSFRQVTLLV